MASNNNYYLIKNHSTIGDSNISFKVFESIVEKVILKNEVVRVATDRSKQANKNPIRCEIKKDNLIYINADIAIKKGNDIKTTCDSLIDEIDNAILLMCETKPSVKINVAEIDV